MAEISKATKVIGIQLAVPEEGPVISRDEVVTTTASSMTVTTVTKTRAEVNDDNTGKQIIRDTTTTVEKVERTTPTGTILMETKTSESWVKAEEGTLHFLESESTTHSRPGSAGTGSTPQDQTVKPDPQDKDISNRKPDTASTEKPNAEDQKPVLKSDDSPSADLEPLQPPPHCEPKRKSTVSASEPPNS